MTKRQVFKLPDGVRNTITGGSKKPKGRGKHVDWKDLTEEQRQEVLVMYPWEWRSGGFRHERWMYYIMPNGHLTKAKGLHKTSPAGEKAFKEETRRALAAPPGRPEKGDLSCWTSGARFTFARG